MSLAPEADAEALPMGDAVAQPVAGGSGRRAFLVTADQALSSITNLLAALWVAHVVPPAEFGTFALLLLVWSFVMGPVQAGIGWRVLVHPHDADTRPREVLGSSVVLGGLGGLCCLVVGAALVATGSDTGPAMLVLGVALPLLVVQDVGRWLAFARGKAGGAILSDATWFVLQMGAFVALEMAGESRLLTLTLAWAGAGAIASLWLFPRYGWIRPAEVSLRWFKERWSESSRLVVGTVIGAGSALGGAALIAVVSNPVAVAVVRAAILLGRPTTAVQNALGTSMATEVARHQPDNLGILRFQRRTMLLSAAIGLVNMAILLLVPDPVGRAVLGNVWPVIEPLLLPVTLWLVVAAAQAGVPPALYGRHRFTLGMVVQIVAGIAQIVALVVGAMIADAEGAVWGLVVGQTGAALSWWLALAWHFSEGSGKHRG